MTEGAWASPCPATTAQHVEVRKQLSEVQLHIRRLTVDKRLDGDAEWSRDELILFCATPVCRLGWWSSRPIEPFAPMQNKTVLTMKVFKNLIISPYHEEIWN